MDGGGEAQGDGQAMPGPRVVTEGEFAGWSTWSGQDAFEDMTGPFLFREHTDGSVRCAFRAAAKHMNGGGFMHGGCLLTFADFCLFAVSHPARVRAGRDGPAVTVSLNGEFVGPARAGELIEAAGEVVRMGASLLFVRGLVVTGPRPLLNFSGVVKQVRRRG